MTLDAIATFVQQNPILVLMVLYIFYRMYQSRQPWPDYGGNITAVKSLEEWRSLLNGSSLTLVSGPQHLACAVERVRSRDRGAEHRAPTGGLLCDVVPSLQGGRAGLCEDERGVPRRHLCKGEMPHTSAQTFGHRTLPSSPIPGERGRRSRRGKAAGHLGDADLQALSRQRGARHTARLVRGAGAVCPTTSHRLPLRP